MPTLVVATYNIHEWVGRDGQRDPRRTIRVIRELRADVIALQEVSLPLTEPMSSMLSDISEQTGMYATPGHTFVKKDSDYGNLLLSRHRFGRVENIDLSIDSGNRGRPRFQTGKDRIGSFAGGGEDQHLKETRGFIRPEASTRESTGNI